MTNEDENYSYDISENELNELNELYIDNTVNDKNKTNSQVYCNDCNSDNVYHDALKGFVICNKCNSYITNIIDTHFSYIDNNEDSTIPSESIMVNKQLPETSTLTMLVGNFSKNIQRLKQWDAIEYREKKKNDVYQHIKKICYDFSFNKCVEETTLIIYNNVYDCKKNDKKKNIYRGVNYASLIANCFFCSCKHNKFVITTKEIAKIFKIKKTDIKKGSKIYKRLAKEKNFNMYFEPFKPQDFLIKYFNQLNLNTTFLNNALTILNNVIKIKIANSHNPESVAIGILFLIINIKKINITKKSIALKFNISQVTITKTYNKIKPFCDILLNDEICDLLSLKINKYEENLFDDNMYIYNCLKFNIKPNILIPKEESFELKCQKMFNLIKMQNIEIFNKTIFLQNKMIELKINHILTDYRILKNN